MDTEAILNEVKFRTSRSSGAGGQSVNKTETRVELLFDIENSTLLTPEEKETIAGKLRSRINKDGMLAIAVQTHRSQIQNKEEALALFRFLLMEALKPKKIRKPTKKPATVDDQRLEVKKIQSEKKSGRKKVGLGDFNDLGGE